MDKKVKMLKQSEIPFSEVMEGISDITLATDTEGRFTYVSPSVKNHLGYTPSELIGKYSRDFAHPDDHPKAIERSLDIIHETLPFTEYRIRAKSGEYRWFRSISKLLFKDNKVIGRYGVMNDINDKKNAEIKLRESEIKYKNIFNNLINVYVETSFDGTILEISPSIERLMGFTREELLGTSGIIHYVNVEDRNRHVKELQKEGQTSNYYLLIYHKDGSKIPVSVSSRLHKDDQGQEYIISMIRDERERKKAELLLRESEEKYRTLFDSFPLGITISDPSGNILESNIMAEKLLGVTKSAHEERSIDSGGWSIVKPDGSPMAADEYASVKALNNNCMIENQEMGIVRPDGDITWLNVTAAPIPLENYGVAITYGDITDRKKAKENLRKSENKFRAIANYTYDWEIWHSVDGTVQWVNPSVEVHTGYTPEEYLAMPGGPIPIIYEEDRSMIIDTISEAVNKRTSGNDLEFRIKRKDGSISWMAKSWQPSFGEKGEYLGIRSSIRDINDRKQAESEINRKQKETEALYISTKLLIEESDFETTVRKLFDICRSVIGGESGYVTLLKNDEAENEILFLESGGLPCDVNPELPMPIRGLRAEAYRTGQVVYDNDFENSKWIKYMPKGHVALKNVLFAPLIIGNKTVGLMGFANKQENFDENDTAAAKAFGDLAAISLEKSLTREKMRLQEEQIRQSQKMEAIGSLAGGIAHDFNNILFPIIGMSEMLLEDLTPGSLERENAEEIFKAGTRGNDLVKQILAFSRQSEHKLIPTQIQTVLKEVIKLTRSAIPTYIEINQDIQQDCGMVLADPTQIHQIGMNIITNAYHALEDTGGKISIKLKQNELETPESIDINLSSGAYAVLSISDTGHGMSEELIGKIFDPYFTTKEQGKGTGLGLAVVYGIVKEHGGEIKVHSEIGKGSTFDIFLPLIKKLNNTESILGTEEHQGGNERILLVDDEEVVAKLEKQMLERLGYKVTSRLHSVEAIEAFRTNPSSFDLVITDMSMPNISGDALAGKIKSIRSDIPIIVCTGFSERISEDNIKSLGIDGLLMKPILKTELSKTVRKVLDKSKYEYQ